jgi:hypothetical protein
VSDHRGFIKLLIEPVAGEHTSQPLVTSIASVSASVWLLPHTTAFTPCPTRDCMTCEKFSTHTKSRARD